MYCPICKFGYVPEIEENVKQHDIYHDHFLHGIELAAINDYNNFKINDDFSIVIINQLVKFQKRKIAQELAKFPMHETKYIGLPYSASEELDERNVHALLLIHKARAIGLLVIELRSEIWLTNWNDYYNSKAIKQKNHKLMWSISMIWIANAHRRNGYSKLFVENSLTFFDIDFKNVGWYTPFTKDGESFVKYVCPNEFYIAK